MPYRTILLEEADGVVALTLNQPATLNALTPEMAGEINHALDGLRDRPAARALLLTGAGRAFCSGGNLAELELADGRAPDGGAVLEQVYNPMIERLFALPIPVVTAINGPAAGGGCSLALAGDIVYAARSSYLLLAFVKVGLVPDLGASWILPRLAGRARASAMMMLGERIPAEQAEDWGLLYKAVDDAALMTAARATAAALAKGPTLAYQLIRRGLKDGLEKSLTEALWVERDHQRRAGRSDDFAEGLDAFLNKRAPSFRGR